MKKLRTRNEVLESISYDGRNLRFASFEFRDDEELVKCAIQNGGDLEYASFRLQNNDEMCDYFAMHSEFDHIFERALYLAKRDVRTFKSRCGLFAENKEFVLNVKLFHGATFNSPVSKYNVYSEEQLREELFNLRYDQVRKFYSFMQKPYSDAAVTKIHNSPDLMFSLLRIPAVGAWYHNEPFTSIKDSFEIMVDKYKSEQDYFCASKGIGSFPERIMAAVLSQMNIQFEREKVFAWSEGNPNKHYIGRKRYDFYIPSSNTIIEVHGAQHYDKGFEAIGGRNLKDEQRNDAEKYKLAKANGITNYIVVDARRSRFEYIRDSIVENATIIKLYDIQSVEWSSIRTTALGADKPTMTFPYHDFRIKFYQEWIDVLTTFEQNLQ